MSSITKIVLSIVLTSLSLSLSIALMYKALQQDSAQYKKDMECVNTLVSKGIERKDIALIDGVCVVEENIYYTSQNI